MRPEFGPSELQRALARHDKDWLLRCVGVYRQWSGYGDAEIGAAKEDDQPCSMDADDDEPWYDELNPWFEMGDPDRGLALVALAMANYDDVGFLVLISCGMLEDIVSHYPAATGEPLRQDILARIVDEARRTARFRWMLSAVWTYGCTEAVAAAIKQAVGTVNVDNDPLPPRPCA